MLANRKPAHRKGKVQLIDASQWSAPLRRNLGRKNCELGEADIQRILDLYLEGQQETAESKWFDTQDFGYWKITVERPLRLKSQLADERIRPLRYASGDEGLREELYARYGDRLYTEFSKLKLEIDTWLKGDGDEDDDDSAEDGAQLERVCPRSGARSCWMRTAGNVTVPCMTWRDWRSGNWAMACSMTITCSANGLMR